MYEEIKLEQRVLEKTQARIRAKMQMGEERLLHVDAFLHSIGGGKFIKYSSSVIQAFIWEGIGTFEEFCTLTLARKRVTENEIATAESSRI